MAARVSEPGATPPAAGEDRLIDWLRAQPWVRADDLIGDDATLTEWRGGLALTVDHQIEGTHFPAGTAADQIGRRLARVALSDLAAVGARPELALLALAGPPELDHRRFFQALLEECRDFHVRLAGGDLATAPVISASLTLLGSRFRRGRWIRRTNGRPGDRLWLGGPTGLSRLGRRLLEMGATWREASVHLPATLGLADEESRGVAREALNRHLLPSPQIELGGWLAARRRAAAIDVSDGLALDLHRLCRASGCGARLEADRLRPAAPFRSLAERLAIDPWEAVLAGGEDYVLLFSLPRRLRPPSQLRCTEVGELTAEAGRVTLEQRGTSRPLDAAGWDHLRQGR